MIDKLDRRRLMKAAGIGGTGLFLGGSAMAAPFTPPSPVDSGHVENGKVRFPVWRDPADTPSSAPPSPLPPEQRVGFAIVGLGRLPLEEILPAFAQSMKAKPVALVSGSPEKLRVVAAQYGIRPEACYSYESSTRSATIRRSRSSTSCCPMRCTVCTRNAQPGQASMC